MNTTSQFNISRNIPTITLNSTKFSVYRRTLQRKCLKISYTKSICEFFVCWVIQKIFFVVYLRYFSEIRINFLAIELLEWNFFFENYKYWGPTQITSRFREEGVEEFLTVQIYKKCFVWKIFDKEGGGFGKNRFFCMT